MNPNSLSTPSFEQTASGGNPYNSSNQPPATDGWFSIDPQGELKTVQPTQTGFESFKIQEKKDLSQGSMKFDLATVTEERKEELINLQKAQIISQLTEVANLAEQFEKRGFKIEFQPAKEEKKSAETQLIEIKLRLEAQTEAANPHLNLDQEEANPFSLGGLVKSVFSETLFWVGKAAIFLTSLFYKEVKSNFPIVFETTKKEILGFQGAKPDSPEVAKKKKEQAATKQAFFNILTRSANELAAAAVTNIQNLLKGAGLEGYSNVMINQLRKLGNVLFHSLHWLGIQEAAVAKVELDKKQAQPQSPIAPPPSSSGSAFLNKKIQGELGAGQHVTNAVG